MIKISFFVHNYVVFLSFTYFLYRRILSLFELYFQRGLSSEGGGGSHLPFISHSTHPLNFDDARALHTTCDDTLKGFPLRKQHENMPNPQVGPAQRRLEHHSKRALERKVKAVRACVWIFQGKESSADPTDTTRFCSSFLLLFIYFSLLTIPCPPSVRSHCFIHSSISLHTRMKNREEVFFLFIYLLIFFLIIYLFR